MSSSAEVFNFIIEAIKQSNKGVFSKWEVIDFVSQLREEHRKSSVKELQKEIWEVIGKQRGGDIV